MRLIVLTLWLLGPILQGTVYAQAPRPATPDTLAPRPLKPVRLLGDAALRHGNTITNVVPLPDGKRALTSARDGSVRLWDMETGKELRRFCHPKGEDVWNFCLVPGRPEFLAVGEDGCVTHWHLDSGKILRRFVHGTMVFRVAVDNEGKRCAAGDDKKLCTLWDLQTGKRIRRFKGHKDPVYTVQFSKDGKTLITGSADDTVRFWSVRTGWQKRQIKKGSGSVYTLAPSPDKSQLLVCCSKKSLWNMDAATGRIIWDAGLPKGVTVAAWAPDGATIAAVCNDGKLYVLNAENGKQRRHVPLPGGTHWSVAFSRDGKQIMCGADHLVCRFEAATGARIFPKPGTPLQYGSVDILLPVPGARLLVQAGGEKGVRLQDADSGKIQKTWLPKQEIKAMAISPDGRLLLAVADDVAASLLETQTGKLLRKLGHRNIRAVAFTHDGQLAVTAGGDNQAVLWRVRDGRALRSFLGHQNSIAGLAISEDNALLATASYDDTLRVWDMASGSQLGIIKEGKDDFLACAFVPSGYGSLVAVSKGYVYYWDAGEQASSPLTKGRIQQLVVQLGADAYDLRDKATRRLIRAGRGVLPTLAAVRSKDAEVVSRLRFIRLQMHKSLGSYRKVAAVARNKALSGSLSFHPDGRHWAAVRGRYLTAEVLIGEIKKGKLKVLHTIKDPNMPHTASFGDDGELYVGNLNGTVSVYLVR